MKSLTLQPMTAKTSIVNKFFGVNTLRNAETKNSTILLLRIELNMIYIT